MYHRSVICDKRIAVPSHETPHGVDANQNQAEQNTASFLYTKCSQTRAEMGKLGHFRNPGPLTIV